MALIDQKTAQQIVETVKDVCGCNVNFILPTGKILASTDPDRVGDYHEIGHRAALEGRMLEVTKDSSSPGSRRGVNLPFSYRGEMVAVIGITGDPDQVRRYAYLAKSITYLILREKDLNTLHQDERERCACIVRSLTTGEQVNRDYLASFLAKRQLTVESKCRTLLVTIHERSDPGKFSLLEKEVLQLFESAGSDLYSFSYPGKYCLILSEERYQRTRQAFLDYAKAHQSLVRIGVGTKEPLTLQNRSFENAELALNSLLRGQSFAEFEALDLPLLLAGLPGGVDQTYIKRTVEKLTEKERRILSCYFSTDCSLKKTAERLFVHVNTLQYQLTGIREKTGYDPRRFRDGVVLYLGLLLMERREDETGEEMESAESTESVLL